MVIAEPVYAELAAHFPSRQELDEFLDDVGIRLHPSGVEALYLAGKSWQTYLRRRSGNLVCPFCGASVDVRCAVCGSVVSPRQHVVADFLIGAHAIVHGDRLLTRDRGYYKTYFPELRLA